jgi:flagellar hook-associated protein 1 FlgK
MSSLFGLLGTIGEGLAAQQAGLSVTGQNVTNANTPGYVKRTAVLETAPDPSGDGGGVVVQGTARQFNAFTYANVLTETGLQGAADARNSALASAQAIVAPTGGGSVGDAMTAFFSSLQTLSASPSDPSARAGVLAGAAKVAQAFSTTSVGLAQSSSSMLTQAATEVSQVNTQLAQLATLNGQISSAQGEGDDADDLRDTRDALVTTIAGEIGGRVVSDPSGSETLFAAGTALVASNQASTMSVSLDENNALKFTATEPGGSGIDITQGVTSGSLGGIREARDEDVATTSNQLDQLAYTFANAVNAIHEKGYGLDGVSGRPLFAPASSAAGAAAAMAVDPSVLGQPNNVAATANAADLPGGNDLANELAGLADQSLGSSGTPTQQFGAIAGQLGTAVASASSDAQLRADTLTEAQNLNSSASGVSLSEETINLTRYQQAFEAATTVLQTVNTMLQDFMTTMSTAG